MHASVCLCGKDRNDEAKNHLLFFILTGKIDLKNNRLMT